MSNVSVYQALAEHQLTEEWQFKEAAKEARKWLKLLIGEFNLDVGPISLCIDRLSRNTLGYFRSTHNGFGLLGEIAINSDHLRPASSIEPGRPKASSGETRAVEFNLPWDAIGTIFHEVLHAHQAKQGTASSHNHHNKDFQDRAAEFGLVVDRYGVTTYDPNGRFIALLKTKKVDLPENLETLRVPTHRAKPKGTGKSKLKKWSCKGCLRPQNVWAGAAEVEVICKRCETQFVKQTATPAMPVGQLPSRPIE